MTLPAGYTSPLFRYLYEREYQTIDEFWRACFEYDQQCGIRQGLYEWFEILYDSDPRKLPITHLTYLVCSLIDDLKPKDRRSTRWSREESSDFGPEEYGSLRSERGGLTKSEWTKGRLILSLIHISEPTRRYAISYDVFC